MGDFLDDTWPFWVFIIIVAVGLWFLIPVMIKQEKVWDRFKVDNHCVNAGEVSGDVITTTGFGLDSKGSIMPIIGTSVTASKTIYKCDGDKTFIR